MFTGMRAVGGGVTTGGVGRLRGGVDGVVPVMGGCVAMIGMMGGSGMMLAMGCTTLGGAAAGSSTEVRLGTLGGGTGTGGVAGVGTAVPKMSAS